MCYYILLLPPSNLLLRLFFTSNSHLVHVIANPLHFLSRTTIFLPIVWIDNKTSCFYPTFDQILPPRATPTKQQLDKSKTHNFFTISTQPTFPKTTQQSLTFFLTSGHHIQPIVHCMQRIDGQWTFSTDDMRRQYFHGSFFGRE